MDSGQQQTWLSSAWLEANDFKKLDKFLWVRSNLTIITYDGTDWYMNNGNNKKPIKINYVEDIPNEK